MWRAARLTDFPIRVQNWVLPHGAEAHRVRLIAELIRRELVLDREDRLACFDEGQQGIAFVILEALLVDREVEEIEQVRNLL